MRFLIVLFALSLALYSCDSSKSSMKGEDVSTTTEASTDTIRIANDDLEYEIIIVEPGFNSWLSTQFPREYYSESFLKNRNAFYVSEYNRRVINVGQQYDANLYPLQIDYNSKIEYGLEVNYLLYNYFVFFEKTYKQKL